MIITTLSDNNALEGSGCISEHGFSILIEYNGCNILFDTGKGDLFLKNAATLNKDLSKLNYLAISHGHYDHGGGVRSLLDTYSYQNLTMITGMGFLDKKFVVEDGKERYLGVDFDGHYLNAKGVIWKTVCTDTLMIHPGVFVVSSFSHIENKHFNPRFLIEREDTVEIDHFEDEISLVFDTPKGLVLIVGCSHPGIMSMLASVSDRFARPIYALLGGIHLFDVEDEERRRVLDNLISLRIPLLGVSHCTGDKASKYLEKHYPYYFLNSAGTVTTILS